jgi:tetratricopeptide (TPR) repeat protein
MRLAALALILAPTFAFAAGSSDSVPPKPTATTQQCSEGLVFDLATKTCITPAQSTNDDDARINDVRALVYDGRYADALDVLDTMQDQSGDMVITYRGFATRKSGEMARGMAFYETALALNPDNLLARSYMGQALVEQGQVDLALAQLTEIRMRGGRGTWAETSLANAVATSVTYSH